MIPENFFESFTRKIVNSTNVPPGKIYLEIKLLEKITIKGPPGLLRPYPCTDQKWNSPFQSFNFEVKPQANQGTITKEEVKKGRCHMCPSKKDQKSCQKCSEWKLNVCDKHSQKRSIVCLLCSEKLL